MSVDDTQLGALPLLSREVAVQLGDQLMQGVIDVLQAVTDPAYPREFAAGIEARVTLTHPTRPTLVARVCIDVVPDTGAGVAWKETIQ